MKSNSRPAELVLGGEREYGAERQAVRADQVESAQAEDDARADAKNDTTMLLVRMDHREHR